MHTTCSWSKSKTVLVSSLATCGESTVTWMLTWTITKSLRCPVMTFTSQGGLMWADGGGNQWINTPFYRQVWHKIYEEYPQGGFSTKQWTVKADPDTLFIPARLSARLQNQPVPATGLYIEHCKGVDYGFFGSLEVMSKTAALILFQNLEKCYNGELNWKGDELAQKYGWYGEDLFAQRCMDLHNAKKIWQFDLVADGTCPQGRPWGKEKEKKWIPDEETCRERDTFVAFKPLKFPDKYFACLSAINSGRTYDI